MMMVDICLSLPPLGMGGDPTSLFPLLTFTPSQDGTLR